MTLDRGAAGRWTLCPAARPDAALRLFCFPHAGGAASFYRGWPARLPSAVEVHGVELPGRGARLREPPAARLPALLDDLVEALLPKFDRPFAFFGHSMGALLGYEAARLLCRRSGPRPSRLFVSAARAPGARRAGRPIRERSDAELVERLRDLNGTPAPVLAHGELMALLLPALRADYTLLENHVHVEGPPLEIPISAFGGARDAFVRPERLAAWRDHTTDAFSLRMFPGDHFYLHSAPARFLAELGRELEEMARALQPRRSAGSAAGVELAATQEARA